MITFLAGLAGALVGAVLFGALAQATKAREEAHKAMLALEEFKSSIVMVGEEDDDDAEDDDEEFGIN